MGNNGSSPYPPLGNFGGQTSQPSSGISFAKNELENAGGRISDQTSLLTGLVNSSNKLNVPFPHFGVVGMGLQGLHQKAIQSQQEALRRAGEALGTWEPALRSADANYRQADDDSGLPPPGLGDLGPLDGLGGLRNTGLPKLPEGSLPGGSLPDGSLPDGSLPGGSLPDGSLPGGDLPGGNLPGTDLPGANLPGGADPNDMRVPDLDTALNNPGRTDLSSFQPTTPNIGSHLPADPSLGTRTGTFGGPASGQGAGLGANGAVPGTGAAAGLRAGASGMPMMPFMPMGGAGAGDKERDRDKAVGLAEDEGVWGGDEDIAPEVIGGEDM
ncbi:MAG TPA: hypothetical protein VFV66_17110 [Nonomuraea sp.]|nr:hypothetical protein [Nonomuraea sp.]